MADIIWEPHAGAQQMFLSCPADEVLLAGSRGGGKTDVLIMDFLQHVGQGFGSDWMGVIFRQEYTQLIDVINKCNKWIPQIFPGAKFNGSSHKWTFPDGEMLYLRNLARAADYYSYHGWEIPFLGFEELTNWATMECYQLMLSTNRSSNSDVPLKVRATTNPSGVGHGAVKRYFIDPAPAYKIHKDPETNRTKVYIPCMLEENTTLLKSNPNYRENIIAATQDDASKYKAWVLGSWDIVAGGSLVDLWEPDKQIFRPFRFPESWAVYRSFDWGSAKPWAVTYGAECNGEQPGEDVVKKYNLPYFPKGSIIIINEIYGWNGTVNEGDRATSQEIAERVLDVDNAIATEFGCRVYSGPADTSIWEVRDGTSIGANMASYRLFWKKAYKGSGSRVSGLALIRQMLGATKRGDLETPGLYFFEQARHHIRTFPLLQADAKKPEDIDSDGEDHCYDCLTGGTLVITAKGSIPIRDLVGTTGMVRTVNGEYTKYYDCRLVHEESELVRVHFEDGSYVDCTPNHEFLTLHGMIKAKDLLTHPDTHCISDVKVTYIQEKIWNALKWCQVQCRSFKASGTISAVNTSREKEPANMQMVGDYTKKCTLLILVKFLQGIMSTIKIEIKRIINQITLSYYQVTGIPQCTKKGIKGECQKSASKRLLNGTKVSLAQSSTKNTTKGQRRHFIENASGNVPIVEKCMQIFIKIKRMCSAQTNVNQPLGENQGLMMLKKNVLYVPKHLQLINTTHAKPVVVSAALHSVLKVGRIEKLQHKEPTYCLTADKTHSFILGNGVVSSNSLRYLITRKMSAMKHKKVKM